MPYLIDDREQLRDQAPLAYRHIQQAPLSDTVRRHCLEAFQSWLLARFDDLTLKEILVMLGELTPLEQTRAYREIVEENKPLWLDEGRRREASALILCLLQSRFGTLAAPQRARVQALPVEQLEDLGEALLDFAAGADLDDWLNGRAKQPKAE